MPPSATGRRAARNTAPIAPRIGGRLEPARLDGDAHGENLFDDECDVEGVEYLDADLSGRTAVAARFERCVFRHSLLDNAVLDRTTVTDVLFDACSVANSYADEVALRRVRLDQCRITGAAWSGGHFRDVHFEHCNAGLASFRFSRLRNVTFTGCRLSQADFEEATLTDVRFSECDLTAAQFHGAEANNVTLSDCNLTELRGIAGLRGATVSGGDLLVLVTTLGRELGITVEW